MLLRDLYECANALFYSIRSLGLLACPPAGNKNLIEFLHCVFRYKCIEKDLNHSDYTSEKIRNAIENIKYVGK